VKLPRDILGSRAIAALLRPGFVKTRQTGSHIRLSKGRCNVTVPNHPSVAPGTLQSIIKQAGVDLKEFPDAL
jgi:predicted RNA binding protein YcfA (HicA-like mRNA interferase family)